MYRIQSILIILCLIVFCSCTTEENEKVNFAQIQRLENLKENDTLYIEACIHHHCGGEWGGCLEWNKIYRKGNKFEVKFMNGIKAWGKDTLYDPIKIKSFVQILADSNLVYINAYLDQVSAFSDSLSLTSNGPDTYFLRTSDYKKLIVRDWEQWPYYRSLISKIYKPTQLMSDCVSR